ncbi:MAG: cyclopropane-fatty-acyl-phospholipid synthase family protein [Planctomycetota bacterium]|nr:cyclopropane-fatty-acyl-phospholipid synthase family protein [Planctomycetota bacterium]
MLHAIDLAEHRCLPDSAVRWGIRRLLRRRLADQGRIGGDAAERHMQSFVAQLQASPLRVAADEANQQHYEVPAEFFQCCLGRRLKYSCCLFDQPGTTLDAAEEAMLRLTCQRAELADGTNILELGCGWGSLSLWMAQQYPTARIVAVSNSHKQKQFIQSGLRQLGLSNLQVITADMADFQIDRQFDRVVSVEMFEHMRNYEELQRRIAGWLKPDGKLFVHVFCHETFAYLFETNGKANWMGRHFFTGGMMPSADLLPRFHRHLQLEHQWRVDGTHYGRTAEAWLNNLDAQDAEIEEIFAADMPRSQARLQVQRWRMFFMACAELFSFDEGRQWRVAHYRFHRSPDMY